MNIHCFQHVPFEGPGCIGDWARRNGHRLTATRFWLNEPLPQLSGIDWLVIMGGPMNVGDQDRYPWLETEKKFLLDAVGSGKTVLGICLGAQLLARVLGSRVYANPQKEIGWFPVRFTSQALERDLFRDFPEEITVFHWHGDTFDLPPGAIPLAASAVCGNQGFLYAGRIIGLQFHVEVTAESVGEMVREGKDELEKGYLEKSRYVQAAPEILRENRQVAAVNDLMYRLLNRLSEKFREK